MEEGSHSRSEEKNYFSSPKYLFSRPWKALPCLASSRAIS